MFTVLFGNRFLIMFWLDVCSLKPTTASAPASPVLVSKPRPLSMALPSSNSSPLGSPTISTDAPKKRRAPQPPIRVSQSCTSDPRTRQRLYSEPNVRLDGDQVRPLLTWCVWCLSKALTTIENDKIKGDVFYFWALIKIKMFLCRCVVWVAGRQQSLHWREPNARRLLLLHLQVQLLKNLFLQMKMCKVWSFIYITLSDNEK